MTLAADEFIRRFLLHVLPKGFVRIRQYGLLANRCREDSLARCRTLLGCDDHDQEGSDPAAPINASADSSQTPTCPVCEKGSMVRTSEILAPLRIPQRNRAPPILNSS